MKTSNSEKAVAVAVVSSIFTIALYDINYPIASLFRMVSLCVLIGWFVLIWMRATHLKSLFISMIIPVWLIILIHPKIITDQLFFLKKEAVLLELAMLFSEEKNYQLLNYYLVGENEDRNEDNVDDEASFSLAPDYSYFNTDRVVETLDYRIKEVDASRLFRLKKLLKKATVIGFQIGHECIIFHFKNRQSIRYYYQQNHHAYSRDVVIKGCWYWVMV